jgi:hypothetical protein
MAVITEVHPGLDSNIRVVTMKTATGTLKRPVTKICSLPHIDLNCEINFLRCPIMLMRRANFFIYFKVYCVF